MAPLNNSLGIVSLAEIPTPSKVSDAPRSYLGASEIGLCPRKAWFRLIWLNKGADCEPSPITLASQLKMNRGNYLEPLVVRALEASGFTLKHTLDEQVEIQVMVDEENTIEGHPDGEVEKCPFGEYGGCGLEIKTAASWMFRKIKKDGLPSYYLDQGYLYNIGQKCEAKGRLYAIFNVESGDLELIHVPHDAERADELMVKGRMILRAMESGDPPPAESVANWECNYCAWGSPCTQIEVSTDDNDIDEPGIADEE